VRTIRKRKGFNMKMKGCGKFEDSCRDFRCEHIGEHEKDVGCDIIDISCPKCEPVKKQAIVKKRKWGSVCPKEWGDGQEYKAGKSCINCFCDGPDYYLAHNEKMKFTLCALEAGK
jgi:hypothetical protein